MKLNIIGLDEAGRGAWAGPVYAGACLFLNPNFWRTGVYRKIDDSKKLTRLQREEAFAGLKKAEIAGDIILGVGFASSAEIDELGIRRANREAMQRALDTVRGRLETLIVSKRDFPISDHEISGPYEIYVDGNDHYEFSTPPDWSVWEFVQGDSLYKQIGAASIIAKVTRDQVMRDFGTTYPGYGFAEHKWYGTSQHQDGLAELGSCAIHRFSYAPLRLLREAILEENEGLL